MPAIKELEVNTNETKNQKKSVASAVMLSICFLFAASIIVLTLFNIVYTILYFDFYDFSLQSVTILISLVGLLTTILSSFFIDEKDKKRTKIFKIIIITIIICISITLVHLLTMLFIWLLSPKYAY